MKTGDKVSFTEEGCFFGYPKEGVIVGDFRKLNGKRMLAIEDDCGFLHVLGDKKVAPIATTPPEPVRQFLADSAAFEPSGSTEPIGSHGGGL